MAPVAQPPLGPHAIAAVRLATSTKPIDIHLDFEAEAADEILQRLTALRAQMLPPPVRQ